MANTKKLRLLTPTSVFGISSDAVNETHFGHGSIVELLDGNDTVEEQFLTLEQFLDWRDRMERRHWVKQGKGVKAAVDPKHYKDYIDKMQWLDAMSRIPTLREPAKFEAAVELQIRKYLDRNGQKDDSVQELLKARFYIEYLIAYKHAGRPILVSEVASILASI